MSCWVIIPVKRPGQGKTRLAGVLDEFARRILVEAMLGTVVDAANAALTVSRTNLIGPSRHGLPNTIPLLTDPGGGLNAALASALVKAECGGASRVIIVAADLPKVTACDIELLSVTSEVAIAPDRHGTGTNAMSLPLPAARGFAFEYGPSSFDLHAQEVWRLGLDLEVIQTPGLMHDVDEPIDLSEVLVR